MCKHHLTSNLKLLSHLNFMSSRESLFFLQIDDKWLISHLFTGLCQYLLLPVCFSYFDFNYKSWCDRYTHQVKDEYCDTQQRNLDWSFAQPIQTKDCKYNADSQVCSDPQFAFLHISLNTREAIFTILSNVYLYKNASENYLTVINPLKNTRLIPRDNNPPTEQIQA